MYGDLIALVRSYPCLYDKNNSDYNDEIRKHNIWESIGETVGYSGEECENQFISLRRKYMRERKDYETKLNNSGNGIVEEPTWKWYAELDFLRDHIKSRRSIRTKGSILTNEVHTENFMVESPTPSMSSLDLPRLRLDKKKRKKPTEDSYDNSFEKEIVKHLKNIENEDEVFGQLIALELKKMDTGTKKRVKHAIYTITMFPEKIDNLVL